MPYMQRITWSGVALHAGVVPGYPASHGCIRLPQPLRGRAVGHDQARRARHRRPGRHRRRPDRQRAPASAHTDAGSAKRRRPTRPNPGSCLWPLTGQATDGVEAAAGATPRVLNPLERARAAKIRTAAEAIAKSKAAKAATELSAVKAAQANKAIAGLRTAELALAAAQQQAGRGHQSRSIPSRRPKRPSAPRPLLPRQRRRWPPPARPARKRARRKPR